jgi:hypothetical protein
LVIEGDLKDKVVNSLSVEEIDFLKPHEETHLIGKLRVAEGILKDRKFTWPIFSDKVSGVILDGMHRWNLLKDFCFFYVPVQHIDYLNNDKVILDVWCRVIRHTTEEEFQLAMKEEGLEEVDLSGEEVHTRDRALLVSPNNRAYMFREKMAAQFEYYRLKTVEERFGISKKVNVGLADYKVEGSVIGSMNDADTVVIFPRPLTKQDVVDVAQRGEVFPPKTTRHIFQFRVFNIEVFPMDLQTFKSHELLAQHLRKDHRSRKLTYIGKGINIDRYYEEHMFKFE